jgi:hypothetical protein
MSQALAFNLDRASPQGALQRHLHQHPVCDLSKHLQVVSVEPSSHPQHGAECRSVSCPKTPNGMGHIVSQALWKRVGHGVTRKQLRHALDVSDGTIDNLLAGRGEPSVRVLMGLVDFFEASFANEIFGHLGIVVVKPAESTRKVQQGLEELSRADPTTIGLFAEVFAKMGAGR